MKLLTAKKRSLILEFQTFFFTDETVSVRCQFLRGGIWNSLHEDVPQPENTTGNCKRGNEIFYMDQYCLIIQRFPCMYYKTNFRTYSMSFVSCCFDLSFPSEALTMLPFVISFAIFFSPSLNDLPVVYHCTIARQIASSMCNCHSLIMKLHEYTFVQGVPTQL